jgi:hypothetical protein
MIDKMLTDIRQHVSYRVAEGFDSRDTIIESIFDRFGDAYPEGLLDAHAEKVTDEEFAEHYRQQATWTSPTDCDRLNQAYEKMNERGIVARQHFACCNNCGVAEIWDEIDALSPDDAARGYAFYHLQATETAYKSGELVIVYASIDEATEDREIGEMVGQALTEAGLTVKWNGDPTKAIRVVGLEWKRRRDR